MAHPKVLLAAVIGLKHSKWDERPLLLVKLKESQQAEKQEILEFLKDKVAKWWMPNDVQFVNDMPIGPTGKILKKDLREKYKDYKFPDDK